MSVLATEGEGVTTPALLLLVVLAFISLASAVIIVAALVQKPTRQWREQWARNTADLREAGTKTLRGEPVQPKRVSFDELWVGVEAREAGLVAPPGAQPVHVPASGSAVQPEVPHKTSKYPPWSPPPEAPPPPTFDELLAADLIGTTNPGASDISATPDATFSEFLVTLPSLFKAFWEKVTSRASDAFGSTERADQSGPTSPLPALPAPPDDFLEPVPAPPEPPADFLEPLPAPPEPPADFSAEETERQLWEQPTTGTPELGVPVPPSPSDEPHGYVHWFPHADEVGSDEDAPSLSSWVGGLKYLQEPHTADHWSSRLPKLSETAPQLLEDDPNVLS